MRRLHKCNRGIRNDLRPNQFQHSYILPVKSREIHPVPLFSLPPPAELPFPLLTSMIVYTPIGINCTLAVQDFPLLQNDLKQKGYPIQPASVLHLHASSFLFLLLNKPLIIPIRNPPFKKALASLQVPLYSNKCTRI